MISFLYTFLILITTLIFIFIQVLKSNNIKIINLLSIEICVLFIASYFYNQFIKITNKKNINYLEIIKNRYYDWSLTTPLLLLTFLLLLSYENNKILHFWKYIIVVILNYLMLFFGFLAETFQINKNTGLYFGFLFFACMIIFIYYYFIQNSKKYTMKIVFFIFTIIWSLYGIAFLFNDKIKNELYNNLDIISKSLFSIFIWIYYGNIFRF